MPHSTDSPRRIAVIGGGITGLAAAQRLRELDASLEVTLWEASNRLGGVLQTDRRDGFLIERSADMFITREPWALQLCRRIGLEDELIETNERYRRAFVVRRGRLIPVPAGFTLLTPTRLWPLVTSPLLSWPGKFRMAGEYFVRQRQDTADESLASFTRRRLGQEAFERLVQPLVGGIYTADPERLSMSATMRQFVEMERRHGGLLRALGKTAGGAAMKQASGARYGMFVAPRAGMGRLIEVLADRLGPDTCRLQSPVRSLLPAPSGGWQLSIGDDAPLHFDAVIVATPAPVAARLLQPVEPSLAGELGAIEHAGAAVVVLAYRRDQVQHPLDGFGFVVPLMERRRILAGSFASVKFPGRAPDDHVLLRIFVGGACQPELLELDDDAIRKLVDDELAELLGVEGPPLLSEVVRWHDTMPQYHVGHLERVERIEQRVAGLRNLELCGNAYRGVGIPFCVRDGERAAERLLSVPSSEPSGERSSQPREE